MDLLSYIPKLAQPAAQQQTMPGSPPVLSPRAVVGQAGPPPELALPWAGLCPAAHYWTPLTVKKKH